MKTGRWRKKKLVPSDKEDSMADNKKTAAVKEIEKHKKELGISNAVFEGVKAANGWKSGKQVTEDEFRKACAAFLKAPAYEKNKNREAKG